jgi:hypothetical protein
MAKLTTYNIAIGMIVAIGTFGYGYGFGVFVSSPAQKTVSVLPELLILFCQQW